MNYVFIGALMEIIIQMELMVEELLPVWETSNERDRSRETIIWWELHEEWPDYCDRNRCCMFSTHTPPTESDFSRRLKNPSCLSFVSSGDTPTGRGGRRTLLCGRTKGAFLHLSRQDRQVYKSSACHWLYQTVSTHHPHSTSQESADSAETNNGYNTGVITALYQQK